MTEIFQGSNVDEVLDEMFAHIKTQTEHPALPKSGFTLDSILHLNINFHRLLLTRGSSYIELPAWITYKKSVINPKNEDEQCFKYAVIAALHHDNIGAHPERISKLRTYIDKYNSSGLEFPLEITKIGKFEKNKPAIAINVLFICEDGSKKETKKDGKFTILCRSKYNRNRSKIVNLLLITQGEKRHYTCIKSLSRLLGKENSSNCGKKHFCLNCLQGFTSIESRDKHYKYCIDHEAVKISMPTEKDKWLQYHDGQKQLKVPFIMYADFESILMPINDSQDTNKINEHIPCGFGVYSKFAYGDIQDPLKIYRGKDCVEKFINHIEKEAKRLYEIFPQQPMIPLAEDEQREHYEATECHICLRPFDDPKNNRKVKDHCHYTGKYRGAAHNKCNISYKIPNFIPIVFHNLSGYDAHLFIRQLGDKFNTEDIGCIAENKEKIHII